MSSSSFVDRLLSPELRAADSETYNRARVIAQIALLAAVWTVIDIPVFLTFASAQLTCVVVAMMIAVSLSIAIMRVTQSPVFAAHWMCFAILVGVSLVGWLTGGSSSPLTGALNAVPLIAFLVSGWRAGLGWALVAVAMIGVFLAATVSGVSPPNELSPSANVVLRSLVWVGMLTVIVTAALVHHGATTRALASLGLANEELSRARDVAEAANRAKSAFLANMSHELRTPMNAVIGALDILRDAKSSAERDDFLKAAHESAAHLLGLLNNVLDLSKIEADKLELEKIAFDPARIAESVVTSQREEAAKKRIELAWEPGVDLPPRLRGDAMRLKQVILNLVSNAIKFTSRGSVTVRMSVLSSRPGDSKLRFEVEDTGTGMSAKVIDSLFQPFHQADASTTRCYGGTGLGLAISRRFVELMGGLIQVESTIGRGSRFWFDLSFEPTTEAEAIPLEPAKVARPMRVLVAEDNATNLKIVLKQLERLGVSAMSVENGRAAVDAAFDEAFDLILMDCQMPELDGFAATREIRERETAGRRTPIIALTASAMSEDREHARRVGMDDYLAKPISRERLAAVIAECSVRESLR